MSTVSDTLPLAQKPLSLALRLDPGASTPMYVQVAQELRRWLHSGGAPVGTALPSERDLAAQLGVSRVTLRQALSLLTEQRLLERRRGSGTFILPSPEQATQSHRIEHPLGTLTSFSDDMHARGLKPGARILDFALKLATPQEAMLLNLGASSQVYRIRRLRTADGSPLAVESSVLPFERVGELSSEGLTDQSLYALLAARQLSPVRALRHLRAVNADAEYAALLDTEIGAALLMTERVSWNAAGTPIEMAFAHYRGDRYDFLMELHQNPDDQ
ncbi:GntR family transcriptional regulator [Deinococcus sp.]|uniref:GntR family transcriptional regulator n=1 Tax=Deinococcus sp. TaxID=47478 RepID=UPI0025DB4B44|nr:GntR family transcriptional regulator [Deinococcus sp.]